MDENQVPPVTQGQDDQPVVNPAPAQPTQPQYTENEKQLYARLKKAEAENETLKTQVKPVDPAEALRNTQNEVIGTIKEVEERVDLRMAGYSNDEINEIAVIAKAKKISFQDAAKLPIVAKGIESLRKEKQATDLTPGASGRVRTFNGKPIDEIFKDPSASKTDKQAAWQEKLKAGKSRNQSV
jgi:hypothetical protein